jgi:sulfur-oxidizing protein SoxZ
MAGTIKIRAKDKGDHIEVKALMSHAMETGTRKDSKTGELVPAHYIQEVTVEANGEVVMRANWGPAVSKNPYLSAVFTGASKGDTVKVSWVDNKGESASQDAEIK